MIDRDGQEENRRFRTERDPLKALTPDFASC